MYKDVHFSSGATCQTKAMIEVAAVRGEAAPIRTRSVDRIVIPAAAALDAGITGSSAFRILPACRHTVTVPVPAPFPYVPAHVV